MEPTPSFLEIREPTTGRQWTFFLDRDHVTAGRPHKGADQCDILLGTSDSKLISRRHCLFERDANAKYWLIQVGKNCSWLRRKPGLPQGEIEVRQGKKILLASGDVVRIRDELSQKGRLWWEIRFWDTETTQAAPPLSFRYDEQHQQLYFVAEGKEQKIHLSGYQRTLVDFMLRQREPGTICKNDELITAVWPKDDTATEDNLSHLISGLRNRLDQLRPFPNARRHFLLTHRGGYSFHTQPVE